MKMAWAMVCSFLLAAAPFGRVAGAPMPPACVKHARADCPCGGAMPCCKANPSSDPQPAPATPAPTGNPTQLSLLAPGVLAWTLPANPAHSISSASTPVLPAAGAPLYALDCARLI